MKIPISTGIIILTLCGALGTPVIDDNIPCENSRIKSSNTAENLENSEHLVRDNDSTVMRHFPANCASPSLYGWPRSITVRDMIRMLDIRNITSNLLNGISSVLKFMLHSSSNIPQRRLPSSESLDYQADVEVVIEDCDKEFDQLLDDMFHPAQNIVEPYVASNVLRITSAKFFHETSVKFSHYIGWRTHLNFTALLSTITVAVAAGLIAFLIDKITETGRNIEGPDGERLHADRVMRPLETDLSSSKKAEKNPKLPVSLIEAKCFIQRFAPEFDRQETKMSIKEILGVLRPFPDQSRPIENTIEANRSFICEFELPTRSFLDFLEVLLWAFQDMRENLSILLPLENKISEKRRGTSSQMINAINRQRSSLKAAILFVRDGKRKLALAHCRVIWLSKNSRYFGFDSAEALVEDAVKWALLFRERQNTARLQLLRGYENLLEKMNYWTQKFGEELILADSRH